MLFSRKNKFHNPMVEALQEATFVFDAAGEFSYCNRAGRDALTLIFQSGDRMPEQYESFVQMLRLSGGNGDPSLVMLAGKSYDVIESRYEEGRLLRLSSRHEDGHMLRLSSALDVMPWGLISADLSGEKPVILYANHKAGDFLQVAPRTLTGVPVNDVLRVFGIAEDLTPYINAEKICHYDHEVKIAGMTCWYRIYFIPNPSDKPYCLLVVDDTTEAKIMETQYFQAQRLEALGQLAGGVAHDFNNILSIIDGYARMARKSVPDHPDAVGYMEHIAKAVQRGSALTSQLLTFGRHKVSKEKVFDLGYLVEDQEPLLRPLMDASIALAINADEKVFVEAPPDDICQILMNLCVNARDAMPDGGNLIINVQPLPGDQALLEIIDTGCGMSPEVRAKIFDPFFTTKDQGKGTGLGLSMVYGLVKDMKGEIEVNSKPGSGTVFSIRLPLSKKEPDVQEMTVDENGAIHLHGFTALIAEDEPDLLNLVSGMMEELGVKVLKASNGNEAMMLQEDYDGEIDFLLTDVVMPELNGVRLAELFEECRPTSTVMFMSGYPANGQMARVPLPEGAFLMPKPVDFEKLCVVVKSAVKIRNDNLKERLKNLVGQWRQA